MLFTSNVFLFFFFPSIIIIYYCLQKFCKPLKNTALLLASLLFYAWGEPQFVFALIASIIFNYAMALVIDAAQSRPVIRKSLLIFTIGANLSLLFLYKYFDFFLSNLNLLGFDFPLKNIALPIGISFFTFQALSYVIDVYRCDVPVNKNPLDIALYISFFPQLVAGPIVRYQTIAEQIHLRKENFEDFSAGVQRFIIGFSKKVLLANNMAMVADQAFSLYSDECSVVFAWLGALAFSFQILYDFSGYSDMAIGLGKMFGFHFLENFDYPYISKSISEFWRRWHISLSQWFRDYVYFPLGGSRVSSRLLLIRNLFIVWFLTGIWHGASWNFIIWGLYYFVLLAFEKLTGIPDRFSHPYQKTLYQTFTMLSVLYGWVIFRVPRAKAALTYGLSMFGLANNPFFCDNAFACLREYWFFFIIAAICATPLVRDIGKRIAKLKNVWLRRSGNVARVALYMFLFVWSVSCLLLGSHHPFIYFNF